MDTATSPNADQVAYWNSSAGERWATLQGRIDAIFTPLTDAALAYAAPNPGSRVVDIGCGAGATVLALGTVVGASGRVLGVDVSKPMLDVAARRVASSGLDQAQLLLADAASHRFEADEFDLAFSRFGVMFFDDPQAAFVNIRTGLTDGGRVVFACWQAMKYNSWFSVPVNAVRALLPPAAPADPLEPGPFAFADPDRVRSILVGAGFDDIAIEPHRTSMRLGALDEALDFVTQIGPTSRALADAEPSIRPELTQALREALAGHDSHEGVVLEGSIWLVSALNTRMPVS